MNQNDHQLSALLKRWRDIEPAGNFEANVLRRIRLEARASARAFWGLLQPAFVTAALAISIAIGSIAGRFSQPAPRYTETEFMAPTTLAGGYARLATEARR